MSITDAVGRIGEIQSALVQLKTGVPSASSSAAASAGTFADALAAAGLNGGLDGTDPSSWLSQRTSGPYRWRR